MPDYVKQFDLPCYPDNKPKSGRRLIVGLQEGNTFDKDFKGFTLWIGGGCYGRSTEPLYESLGELTQQVTSYLVKRAVKAQKEADYYNSLLEKWVSLPEQFAVSPDM